MVLHRELDEVSKLMFMQDPDIRGLRQSRCAAVSRTDEDFLYERRLGEFPSECMFATTATHDQDDLRVVGHDRCRQPPAVNFATRINCFDRFADPPNLDRQHMIKIHFITILW